MSDNPVASYRYDYLARRISKVVDSNTTSYCYDGARVIAEYEGETLARKFIYGPGIDEPILMIDVTDSNAVYYYHYDGLGSVVALSDANSDIVETCSYDVFGEPSNTSSVGNPYLFTGRRYDPEAGLYYYRARYYNPDIGRFLQTDPVGYYDSLNLYTYCGNNPLNWVDPWGLCKDGKPWWKKLWEGDYVGAQHGDRSLDYWIDRIVWGDGGWDAWAGAFFSSMWTPESWRTTAFTLGSGLAAAGPASRTGPWLGEIAKHAAHKSGPHPYRHIQVMIRIGKHVTKSWRIPY